MALDASSSIAALEREGPLQSMLSTAMAGVSSACGRIGLRDKGFDFEAVCVGDEMGAHDDPNRETWANLNEAVATGNEAAAIAAGLHHQAAAELGEIEQELAAIAALVRRTA